MGALEDGQEQAAGLLDLEAGPLLLGPCQGRQGLKVVKGFLGLLGQLGIEESRHHSTSKPASYSGERGVPWKGARASAGILGMPGREEMAEGRTEPSGRRQESPRLALTLRTEPPSSVASYTAGPRDGQRPSGRGPRPAIRREPEYSFSAGLMVRRIPSRRLGLSPVGAVSSASAWRG